MFEGMKNRWNNFKDPNRAYINMGNFNLGNLPGMYRTLMNKPIFGNYTTNSLDLAGANADQVRNFFANNQNIMGSGADPQAQTAYINALARGEQGLIPESGLGKLTGTSGTAGKLSLGNVGLGLTTLNQVGKGIQNYNTLDSTREDVRDLEKSIKSSAFMNPLATSYLTADQNSLLRKIKSGRYDESNKGDAWGAGVEGALKSIPQAALSALSGYLMSGMNPIGAAVGGIGTLVNSGMSNAASERQGNTAELQALYEALSAAEQDYNAMRRPAGLGYANLQNRYSSLLR